MLTSRLRSMVGARPTPPLPPYGRCFGCRECHRLTYASCQESDRFDGLDAAPPPGRAGLNCTPREVKRLLRPPRA